MLLSFLISSLLFSQWTAAEIHNLFVSSLRTPHMFALDFNTTTNTLSQIGSLPAHAGHAQLALSHDRSTLYGAERNGWSSYSINTLKKIEYQTTVTPSGDCDYEDVRGGITNLAVETKPPYSIIGAGISPCGNVLGVGADGRVQNVVQNISYAASSRIRAMTVDSASEWLYSADSKASKIWISKIQPETGILTDAKATALRRRDGKPSKLVVHPNRKYLYIMHSRANKVSVYNIGKGLFGQPNITPTGLSYSLVPSSVNGSSYRGQDLQLSPDNSILYLTTRFHIKRPDDESEDNEDEGEYPIEDRLEVTTPDRNQRQKRQWPWSVPAAKAIPLEPGFLTAILLESQDLPAGTGFKAATSAGYPRSVLLQVSTSTSGGRSNGLSVAPWSNEYVALADSEKGLVQVWRFEGISAVLGSGTANSPTPQSASSPIAQQQAPPSRPATTSSGPAPPLASQNPLLAGIVSGISGLLKPATTPQPLPKPQTPPPPNPLDSLLLPNTGPKPKGLPPANPLQAGTSWSNPWASGPASKPATPLAKPADDLIPEFNVSPPKPPKSKRQSDTGIRASIVAQWQAPAEVVGKEVPGALGGNRKVPGWGKGCCAFVLWYD